ncbi:MAG: hypothetical protein CL475_03375 [Acidobacteria bacterium]|jgi:gas vesicle protein|nr:hypothetical protein [Acidobacteriota bacterium]
MMSEIAAEVVDDEEGEESGNEMEDALSAAFDESEAAEAAASPAPEAKPSVESAPESTTTTPSTGDAPPEGTTEEPAALTAPASWSPEAREAWKSIPPEVQKHIDKREAEIRTALNDTGTARQHQTEFQRLTQPYQQLFQAQGVDAMTGINAVLGTAAVLQGGTVQQKAETVATLIEDYGIDISALDDLLVGNIQPQSNDPEVAQLREQLAQQQQWINNQQQQYQAQTNAEQQRLNNDAEQFIKTHEFGEDVRRDMARFFDVAVQQGETLTMDEAYRRALSTRPDILKIIQNRNNSRRNQDAVGSAQAAGRSVPQNSSVAAQAPAPTSMRGALEQAWEDV